MSTSELFELESEKVGSAICILCLIFHMTFNNFNTKLKNDRIHWDLLDSTVVLCTTYRSTIVPTLIENSQFFNTIEQLDQTCHVPFL